MKESSIEERLAICKECPIFTVDGRCNSKLWLNPDTNEVSTYARIGYTRGCNCLVKVKARNPYNHCIVGKW